MIEHQKSPLRAFLCHASADKYAVRVLYRRLVADGIDAWLDEEKLIPGQYWRDEITKAVQNADVVIICLSNKSITKEGFVQKEIRFALDLAEEKPEGTIYLIPARLENCEVPHRLQYWQWVDLFFDGKMFNEVGYQNLLRALKSRASKVGSLLQSIEVPKGVYKPKKRPYPAVRLATKSPAKATLPLSNETREIENTKEKTTAAIKVSNSLETISKRISLVSEFVKTYRKTIAIALAVILFLLLTIVPPISKMNVARSQTLTSVGATARANLIVFLTSTNLSRNLTETAIASTPNPATETIAAGFTQLALSIGKPATLTIAAAFTQLAVSTQTIIPTSTSLANNPSPTSLGSRSDATLLLDQNYSCKMGPSTESQTLTAIIEGVRLPIYGKSEKDKWWLVQVQLKNYELGYCWINGGKVEGNLASIITIRP